MNTEKNIKQTKEIHIEITEYEDGTHNLRKTMKNITVEEFIFFLEIF